MIPPYVPIENTGMSIMSALFFFFGGSALAVFSSFVWSKLNKHDNVLDEHKDAIHDTNLKLTRIEGNVDTTKEIVQRIDDSMSEFGKTNTKLIEHVLHRDIQD